MAEVEAGSKNLRRLSECYIQFQMMRFESLSHSYFSNEITCVAVQLVAKGQTIIFPPGGIAIRKKIVCMRKIAEINCLPQMYI